MGAFRDLLTTTRSTISSAGSTEFVSTNATPEPPPATSGEPATASRRSAPKGKRRTNRRQLVRDRYNARETQLQYVRGDAVMPIHTKWFHELKPRMLAYRAVRFTYLTLAVLFFKMSTLPGWFVPFVPRPGLNERNQRAINATRSVEYKQTKFVSFFSFKGGVGKTTLTKLAALLMRTVCNWLVVMAQDCNVDNGTLGRRGPRTSNLSIQDAIKNLKYIEGLADLMRYCTRTVEGLLIMASTRPEDLHGAVSVTRDGLKRLQETEAKYVGLVYNDLGTGSASKTNIAALDASHQVCIPTTGAKDDLEQAILTFKWMLNADVEGKEGKPYAELARGSIIVLNRWLPFYRLVNSPEKIRAQFVEQFGEDFDNVRVLTVNSGALLVATKFFTARLTPRMVSRRVKVQIRELNAAIATRIADGHIDDTNSHLTHLEAMELDVAGRHEEPATHPMW